MTVDKCARDIIMTVTSMCPGELRHRLWNEAGNCPAQAAVDTLVAKLDALVRTEAERNAQIIRATREREVDVPVRDALAYCIHTILRTSPGERGG